MCGVSVVLLMAAVILTGLFAGFLLAMATVVQRMLEGLEAMPYVEVMQGIIREGRASAAVKIGLLGPLALGVLAAVALVLDGSPSFATLVVLVLGLVVQALGPLGLSRWWAEPLYDRIGAWSVQAPPEGWMDARRTWGRINRWRAALAILAFVLLLLALLGHH